MSTTVEILARRWSRYWSTHRRGWAVYDRALRPWEFGPAPTAGRR